MPILISSPIDKYKVVLYGVDTASRKMLAYIHCSSMGRIVLTCEFYQDDGVSAENRNAGGRVWLVYPWSRFDEVLDLLRNEKPLFFGFIESTKLGYIATQEEPVGEGSDQS